MGALTSKPYAFTARPWELTSVNMFDFFDVFGSSIRLDFRGSNLMRVLPRVNDSLNEEWITDKVRFSLLDGMFRQRITNCYCKPSSLYRGVTKVINCFPNFIFNYLTNKQNLTLKPYSWKNVFVSSVKKTLFFGFGSFLFSIGHFSDLEFAISIKKFLSHGFSSPIVAYNSYFSVSSDFIAYPITDWRSDFYFPFKNLVDFESSIRIVIFICFNPASIPLLNVRFRKMFRNSVRFFSFGLFNNQPFDYEITSLGSSWFSFITFVEGKHPLSIVLFKNSPNISFIVGDEYYSFFSSFLPNSIFEFLRSKLSFDICYFPCRPSTFNFLELSCFSGMSLESPVLPFKKNSYSSFVFDKLLDQSFVPDSDDWGVYDDEEEFNDGDSDDFEDHQVSSVTCNEFSTKYVVDPVAYVNRINFFNFGNFSINLSTVVTDSTTFYLSSHSSSDLSTYDYVLPGLTPLEKISTFINFQGKSQSTISVFDNTLKETRDDWSVFSFLLLAYFFDCNISFVRSRSSIFEFFKTETGASSMIGRNFSCFIKRSNFNFLCWQSIFEFLPARREFVSDYYLSDIICQNSPLMALRAKFSKNKKHIF
jgi:hypothetical protein